MQQLLGSKQDSFYKGRVQIGFGVGGIKRTPMEKQLFPKAAPSRQIGDLVPLPTWHLSHCPGPVPASSWLEVQLSARSEGSRQVGRLFTHRDAK